MPSKLIVRYIDNFRRNREKIGESRSRSLHEIGKGAEPTPFFLLFPWALPTPPPPPLPHHASVFLPPQLFHALIVPKSLFSLFSAGRLGKRGGWREGGGETSVAPAKNNIPNFLLFLACSPPLSSRLVKMKEIFPLFSTSRKVGGGMEVSAVERSDTKICAENEIAR